MSREEALQAEAALVAKNQAIEANLRKQPTRKKPALRSGKMLTAAEGEKAVRHGIWDLEEYDSLLKELGYSARDREVKSMLLQAELKLKAPKKSDDEEVEDETVRSFERDAMRISEAIRG